MLRSWIIAITLSSLATATLASACPWCSPEQQTLTEELNSADAVVIARMVRPAPPLDYKPDEFGEFGSVDPDTGKARFAVVDVIRGDEIVAGIDEFEAIFFGEPKPDQLYMVRGLAEPLEWNIPLGVSQVAAEYIKQLDSVPAGGAARLEFFLSYLQHEDPLLALDAADEFARAPYDDVIAMRDKLDPEKLKKWIEDPTISPNRRSLFFTLLGVCGTDDDIPWLERMLLAKRRLLVAGTEAAAAAAIGAGAGPGLAVVGEVVAMEENRKKLGFSALVGCYMSLKGPEALDVIDQKFLLDPKAEHTDVYAAVDALRIAAEETEMVPMERICQSMRLVLDKPDFADQAINDLARWDDWSVLDRLIVMFKQEDQTAWTREAIVAYVDLAAEQEGLADTAEAALAEFEQIDPKSVKNARALAAFGFLGRARGGPIDDGKSIPANAQRPAEAEPDEAASDTTDSDDAVAASDVSPRPNDQIPPNPAQGVEATYDSEPAVGPDPSTSVPPATQPQPAAAAVPVLPRPTGTMVVALPLVGAVVLMGLFYLILRGGA